MCASTTGSHESVQLTVTVQVTVLDDVQVSTSGCHGNDL